MSNILTNKLPQNWRNYSPGGKRRKITKIPFMGEMNNNIRAMGTKRVPVISSYSYMSCLASFEFSDVTAVGAGKFPKQNPALLKRYSELTPNEISSLSPEELMVMKKREERLQSQADLDKFRQTRSGYRAVLDTIREARSWGRELGVIGKDR